MQSVEGGYGATVGETGPEEPDELIMLPGARICRVGSGPRTPIRARSSIAASEAGTDGSIRLRADLLQKPLALGGASTDELIVPGARIYEWVPVRRPPIQAPQLHRCIRSRTDGNIRLRADLLQKPLALGGASTDELIVPGARIYDLVFRSRTPIRARSSIAASEAGQMAAYPTTCHRSSSKTACTGWGVHR